MICAAAASLEAADRLAVLHAACFPRSWTAEAIAGLMETPGTLALEDRAEQTLRGFILVRSGGGEAEILTLAVTPLHRRQGVATGLIEAIVARLDGSVGTLWLEVAADNVAALKLYAETGFEIAGRRPAYYQGGSDAVVMRRTLNKPIG